MVDIPNDVVELAGKIKALILMPEAKELYNAVLDTPKGSVVEIGSACGGSTIILIKAAEKVGKKVYSVDPYPVNLEGVAFCYPTGIISLFKREFEKYILTGEYKNIQQFNEDIKDCIDKIPDELSVIFIDGLHELSNVLTEFNLLFPKLVSGGKIFIHDTKGSMIGQLSGKEEESIGRIWDILDKNLFSEIKNIETMFCGIKK